MDNNVFDAPFRQQQQIDAETDFPCAWLAATPTRDGGFIHDSARCDAHFPCVSVQHGADDALQLQQRFRPFGFRVQRQLPEKILSCLFLLGYTLPGLFDPCLVALKKILYDRTRCAHRCRYAHRAVFKQPHG